MTFPDTLLSLGFLVAGSSLISQHFTKARKAAKKLDAASHCDARKMTARADTSEFVQVLIRSLVTAEHLLKKQSGKQEILIQQPVHHLHVSEPVPHLPDGDNNTYLTGLW